MHEVHSPSRKRAEDQLIRSLEQAQTHYRFIEERHFKYGERFSALIVGLIGFYVAMAGQLHSAASISVTVQRYAGMACLVFAVFVTGLTMVRSMYSDEYVRRAYDRFIEAGINHFYGTDRGVPKFEEFYRFLPDRMNIGPVSTKDAQRLIPLMMLFGLVTSLFVIQDWMPLSASTLRFTPFTLGLIASFLLVAFVIRLLIYHPRETAEDLWKERAAKRKVGVPTGEESCAHVMISGEPDHGLNAPAADCALPIRQAPFKPEK